MNNPNLNTTRAALAALGATFFLFMMNVLGKTASDIYTPMEAVFWRNLMATLCLVPFVLWHFRGKIPPMHKPVAMVSRSIFGSLTLMLSMGAYFNLPLADANAIILSAPLILTLLAVIFLKERVTRPRLACTFLGLVGVIIVAHPSGEISALGAGLAVGAAISVAAMRVLLRHLGKTEDPLSMAFYFLAIGTLCTLPVLLIWGKPPPLETLPVLIGWGVCGALGQYLNGLSYRYGEASFVGMFVYTQLLWAIPFDYMLWDHAPTLTTLLGAGIIVSASIAAVWVEKRRPPTPV